jgi:hypothetical protein
VDDVNDDVDPFSGDLLAGAVQAGGSVLDFYNIVDSARLP